VLNGAWFREIDLWKVMYDGMQQGILPNAAIFPENVQIQGKNRLTEAR
jgi:hypothetical protein